MERRRMDIGFWWESQKERDHQKDLDVGGRMISEQILMKDDVVAWTGLF
jgi:hypothetical protein